MNTQILSFMRILPALLLPYTWLGVGCIPEQTPAQANLPECAEGGDSCWVMQRETQTSLEGKKWQFEPCWGLSAGLLSNQHFPVPSMVNGADCIATLPPAIVAKGGRYRLWLHSSSSLSNPGSQAIVWLLESGSMMPQVLLRGREQGNLVAQTDMQQSAGTSVQSVVFVAPVGASLQLVLRAAPFETLEAGAWQISELSVRAE